MKALEIPIKVEDVRQLAVGELVKLNGVVCTGRDAVHRYLASGGALPDWLSLEGGVLFHCGPVMTKDEGGQWRCLAAGPTTSIRHEMYQPAVIERFRIRAIVGKGGMGSATKDALVKFGCVYLHAVGGAAQVLASCVKRVRGVLFLEEFGPAEAMWILEVENFPAVVTMDCHGNSLHEQVSQTSKAVLERIFRTLS